MHNEEVVFDESDDVQFSVWKNISKDVVTMSLYHGHQGLIPEENGPKKVPSPWRKVVWQPGQSHRLPAEFDAAFHTLSKDGKTIVASNAPQLKKISGPGAHLNPVLHPSLDQDAIKKAAQQEQLIGNLMITDALKQQLIAALGLNKNEPQVVQLEVPAPAPAKK